DGTVVRTDHGPNPMDADKQSTPRLTPKGRGHLASVVANGQWSQSRQFEQGMAVDDSCLLCGEVGTLRHRHCGCAGWPPELRLPHKANMLLEKADMLEVKCLLERVLWPALAGIVKLGELILDGSQLEGDYERYASVAWAVIALERDADVFLGGASGMLCEPHVGINDGELMALIRVLRIAMPPVTVVVDSGFVCRDLLELGPRRTTAHGAACAHLWRAVWRPLGEFGGPGCDGPAHQSERAIDHGKITCRDWLGSRYADSAAKSAPTAGRIQHDDRQRLAMADKLVEGIGTWVSAVGSATDGRDTTHCAAKPNRPAPKAVAAQPAARLSCDFRGRPGKRWCSRCRWVGCTSECPGSITAAALQHNERLKGDGQDAHILVLLRPLREADLVHEMPLVACAACGAVGSARAASFAAPCSRASAKGKLAIARLGKKLVPAMSCKVAVSIEP
ncbi:unnamed protein product, partial [Prorocentrum cordatum]